MESERIVRKRLSDEVSVRLRKSIQTGELKAGDEMPSERELMERFGVGRPAVREALLTLANEGVIEISHGERARVLEITAQSIIDQVDFPAKLMLSGSSETLEHLKSARIFFERGLARAAAEKAKPENIVELRRLIELQKTQLNNVEAFIATDMAFHIEIAKVSGNPIFPAVSQAMLGWLQAYHAEVLIWEGQENYTLEEHTEIVDAIEAKNPDMAENVMTRHLERSRALYTFRPQQTKIDS